MIAQKILSWARQKPDHSFLIEDGITTSYAAMARMIESVRAFLARESPQLGPFAIVLGNTHLEKWVLALALRALGTDAVPCSGPKMANDVSLQNVTSLVAPAKYARATRTNIEAIKHLRLVAVADEALTPPPSDALPEPGPSAKNGGYVVATSGTTGHYKRILFDGALDDECLRWFARALAFDESTVFHGHNFPPWTGVGARLVPPVWHAGGTVIMTSGENFKDFFAHRPNRTILVPVMASNLAAEVGETGTPGHPNLEIDVVGGFLPLSVADRVAKNITPNINVLYGSTEPAAHMRQRFQSVDDLHWLTELNTTYEIVDENSTSVPTGVEGELRVKLRPFDCQGYINDEAATARFFRDGFFYAGDLAVRREDGRIRVLGRIADVINVQGYKIPAAPIEDQIQRRLNAGAVCIFSDVDDKGENRIVVAVESRREFTAAELGASLASRPAFREARFVVLKEFPRTELGTRKVNRRALRKLVT